MDTQVTEAFKEQPATVIVPKTDEEIIATEVKKQVDQFLENVRANSRKVKIQDEVAAIVLEHEEEVVEHMASQMFTKLQTEHLQKRAEQRAANKFAAWMDARGGRKKNR